MKYLKLFESHNPILDEIKNGYYVYMKDSFIPGVDRKHLREFLKNNIGIIVNITPL